MNEEDCLLKLTQTSMDNMKGDKNSNMYEVLNALRAMLVIK